MTLKEIIDGLKTAAQMSLDAAVGEELIVAHFQPEYEKFLLEKDEKTYKRSLQLYWNVIEKRRFAEHMREEADLFLAAVELLEELDKEGRVI